MTADRHDPSAPFFATTALGLVALDAEGRIEQANPALARIVGRDGPELLGRPFVQLVLARDRRDVKAALETATRHEAARFATRLAAPEGGSVSVLITARCVSEQTRGACALLLEVEDANDRIRAEERLALALEAFGAAHFELAPDLSWRSLDASAARILGHPLERIPLSGRELRAWWLAHVDPADRDTLRHTYNRLLAGSDDARVQCRFRNHQGHERWLEIVARVTERNPAGRPQRITGVLQDITRSVLEAQRIQHIAHHDPLTGLPNRSLLLDRIEVAQDRLARDGVPFALLVLDLDHFKDVNDTFGHPVGDELLVAVARRLEATVRRTDTVSRLGGDEFAVVQADLHTPANCARLAQKIVDVLAVPFRVRDHELSGATSIGAVVVDRPHQDSMALIAKADLALYDAKEERGTFRMHSRHMAAEARRQAQLSTDLQLAIEQDDVHLAFLPVLELATRRVVAVEALARWVHPKLGAVPPAEFVRRAEEAGQMVPLGARILSQALEAARGWPLPCPVSVNLSLHQLRDRRFEALVEAELDRHGLPASRLVLELPEGALRMLSSGTLASLERLVALGVGLDVDDAGRGPTHLPHLARLPVRRVKLAEDVVAALDDPVAERTARIVVAVAEQLEIPVVAEGVRSPALLAAALSLGIQEGQGSALLPVHEPEDMQARLRDEVSRRPARGG